MPGETRESGRGRQEDGLVRESRRNTTLVSLEGRVRKESRRRVKMKAERIGNSWNITSLFS